MDQRPFEGDRIPRCHPAATTVASRLRHGGRQLRESDDPRPDAFVWSPSHWGLALVRPVWDVGHPDVSPLVSVLNSLR